MKSFEFFSGVPRGILIKVCIPGTMRSKRCPSIFWRCGSPFAVSEAVGEAVGVFVGGGVGAGPNDSNVVVCGSNVVVCGSNVVVSGIGEVVNVVVSGNGEVVNVVDAEEGQMKEGDPSHVGIA